MFAGTLSREFSLFIFNFQFSITQYFVNLQPCYLIEIRN